MIKSKTRKVNTELTRNQTGETKMENHGFDSSDRTEQVNWLKQEAQTILAYDMSEDQSVPANELVEFWETQDGVEMPEWFSNFDRNLLIRFVGEAAR